MDIIYEDKYIVICRKKCGENSEHSGMNSLAAKVEAKYGYAGVIHRLDMSVGGAILYAKEKITAAKLSSMTAKHELSKEYLAVVHGAPAEREGRLCDLLFKDSAKNKSFVVKRERKGVKKAELDYELLKTAHTDKGELSLIRIKLHTGRSHQIRVQFSSRKMPLLGDGKYGSRDNRCNIALWSYRLSFVHPLSKEKLSIEAKPDIDSYPWNIFGSEIYE